MSSTFTFVGSVKRIADRYQYNFEGPVKSRVKAVVEVPVYLVAGALDMVPGVLVGGYEALRGKFKRDSRGGNHLNYGSWGLSLAAQNLIKILNQNAKFKPAVLSKIDDISSSIFSRAQKLTCSASFWKKHIASRALVALFLVACAVETVAKTAIGLVALPLALLTYGKFSTLNGAARQGIRAPLELTSALMETAQFMIHPE